MIARGYPSLAGRGGLDSGVQRLIETPMLINGLAPSPSVVLVGGDAATGGWTTRAYPATPVTLSLTGAGSDPTYAQGAAFLGSIDNSVRFNGSGAVGASGKTFNGPTDFCNLNTRDAVIEVLAVCPALSSVDVLVAKIIPSAAGAGWITYFSSAGLYFGIREAALKQCGTGIRIPGSLLYALGFFDRSGQYQWYVWGIATGTPSAIGQTGSVDNAQAFSVGGYNDQSLYSATERLGYFAIWMGDAWLDSHLQPTIVAQRFALLTGTRPLISIASATSLAAGGNAGPAFQGRVTAGVTQLHYMDTGAPRFCQKVDAHSRVFTGMCIEAAAINSCLRSQVAGTTWTVVDAAIAASNSDTAPDGTLTADTLTASAAGGYLRQTFGAISAVQRTYSHWLRRNGAGNVAGKIQIIKTSDASVIAEQAFTAIATYQRIQVPGTCVVNDTEIRLVVDTNGESLFVWQGQFETGPVASSEVITTTGAVTRAADTPHRLSGAAHFGPQGFALHHEVLCAAFTPTRNHHLWTAYVAGSAATEYVKCFVDTAGKLNVTSATAGGDSGAVITAAAINDNVIRRYCVSLAHNKLRLWTRGATGGWVEAARDTAVDLVAGLDTLDWGADEAAANQAGPGVWPGSRYQLLDHPVLDPLPEPGGFTT